MKDQRASGTHRGFRRAGIGKALKNYKNPALHPPLYYILRKKNPGVHRGLLVR
jgi:hypothetical protein